MKFLVALLATLVTLVTPSEFSDEDVAALDELRKAGIPESDIDQLVEEFDEYQDSFYDEDSSLTLDTLSERGGPRRRRKPNTRGRPAPRPTLFQYSSCNSVRARSSPTEGRAFDFLSSLSSIRTNILSLLDNTFNTNQKKVRPPPPPPVRPATLHHVPVRPLPPRPAPGIFITSAPQLSSAQNSHFHAAPPQPHSFTLPQSVDTGPIVEVVQHKPSLQPEHVEPPAIHNGPVSFVDSERLNAGSGLLNEIDHGLVHIPKDLWREDIGKIEHELKVDKKVKVEGSFETYKLY